MSNPKIPCPHPAFCLNKNDCVARCRRSSGTCTELESAQPAQALPEKDPAKTNQAQGLYRKFTVNRTDGSDMPSGKHHGCEYFVLDTTHDPYAGAALRAYADACADTHPHLSADLRAKWVVDQPAPVQEHDFKNFHRLLCERFGYVHDEVDWKRDQISLIEWIAKQVKNEALVQEPIPESFCFCDDNISLEMVSGGASPEGLYGSVVLKVNGEWVRYVRDETTVQKPASSKDVCTRARSNP